MVAVDIVVLVVRELVTDSGTDPVPEVLTVPDDFERSERTDAAVALVAPSAAGYMDPESVCRAFAFSRCAAVRGFFAVFLLDTADMYKEEGPLMFVFGSLVWSVSVRATS